MDVHPLKKALEELKKLPFPEFAENDELANWMAELAEMDGHIAGLASSLMGGAAVETSGLVQQFEDLKSKLEGISDFSEDDASIHKACRIYIEKLEEVAALLID